MSHIFCCDCGYYSYRKNDDTLHCTRIKCICGGIAHVLKIEHSVDESTDESIDESSMDEVSVTSDETMSLATLSEESQSPKQSKIFSPNFGGTETAPQSGAQLFEFSDKKCEGVQHQTKSDVSEFRYHKVVQLNQPTECSFITIQLPFD